MGNLAERLIEEALLLPMEDRAEVVDKLLQSLNVPTQSDIDRLWKEEVENRIREYDEKKVESLNGENVVKEISKRFKK